MTRLYQLPRDKNIKLKLPLTINGGEETLEVVTFHHIDGMYSYCTVDSMPEGENVVHPAAFTRLVKEGDFYFLAPDQGGKDEDDTDTQDEKRGLNKN